MPSDDSSLLPGLRQGDVRSYEAVYRAYHPRLCAFAHGYLRNRADADELVQDLFLALWQKRERLEIRSSLRAYLFGAVRNRVVNRSARARLEQRWLQESGPDDPDPADPAPPVDEALETAELNVRVQSAISSLPSRCRRVLELRWIEQLTYAEIAEVLGISMKGVENQLARARKTLRSRLGDIVQ